MEFSIYGNFNEFFIDNLQDVHETWVYCRYPENKWFLNPNLFTQTNEQILPEGLMLKVLLRNNKLITCLSGECNFSVLYKYSATDIIAYKILGVEEGYTYG